MKKLYLRELTYSENLDKKSTNNNNKIFYINHVKYVK